MEHPKQDQSLKSQCNVRRRSNRSTEMGIHKTLHAVVQGSRKLYSGQCCFPLRCMDAETYSRIARTHMLIARRIMEDGQDKKRLSRFQPRDRADGTIAEDKQHPVRCQYSGLVMRWRCLVLQICGGQTGSQHGDDRRRRRRRGKIE